MLVLDIGDTSLKTSESLAPRDTRPCPRLDSSSQEAGPDTIAWNLTRHQIWVAGISRYLSEPASDLEPKKKPKSAHLRSQAQMPNHSWQSDFTHYL